MTAPRLLAVAVCVAGLAGCSREGRVVRTVGAKDSWHLERVRTSDVRWWLSRIRPLHEWLGDTGERWWLVSPQGRRAFVRAVNYVTPGRGDGNADAFMAEGFRNAAQWGFNAFGLYTDPAAWSRMNGRLPALLLVGGCRVWDGVWEDWFPGCQAKAIDGWKSAIGDAPDVLGLLWEYSGAEYARQVMLAYASLNQRSPSKQALVAFMRDRCRGDAGALRVRMPAVQGFDDLAGRTDWDQYEGLDDDAQAFVARVWARYGEIMRRELAARLGRYLNFGPVLNTDASIDLYRALAPYVDAFAVRVLPFDGRLPRRYLEEINRATGKPVFVVEVRMNLKTGNPEMPVVETEAGQVLCYRRAAAGAAALPFVTGFGWSRYRSLPDDGSGFQDTDGTPRKLLAGMAKTTNDRLDGIHRDGPGEEASEFYVEDRFSAGRPAQALGRLKTTLRIDGDLADWPSRGAWLKAVKLSRDLDPIVFAGVRAAWDSAGLALGVEVQDDAVELLDPRVYWKQTDYVEVFVDASAKGRSRYAPEAYHFVLLPRGGGGDRARALVLAIHHPGDSLPATSYDFRSVEAASSFFRGIRSVNRTVDFGRLVRHSRITLRESSWKVEARIPWTTLGMAPKPGARLRFNVVVHRMGAREEEAFWAAPGSEPGYDLPSRWGTVTLQEDGE